MRWAGAAALALLSLAGCGCGSDAKDDTATGPETTGDPDPAVQPAAADGASILVLLDEKEVKRIPLAVLGAAPQPLVDLLDGAGGVSNTWAVVEVKGPEWQLLTVRQEAFLVQNSHLMASRNADGVARVGLYVRTDPKNPMLAVDNTVQIHLRTVIPPEPPPEEIKAQPLLVRIADGPLHTVSDEDLGRIALMEPVRDGGDGSRKPSGAEGEMEGVAKSALPDGSLRLVYHLADFLAAFVDLDKVDLVRLAPDLLDDSIILTRDQATARGEFPAIFKRNSKGRWNYRQDSSDPAQNRALRDVKLIEVQLR